MMWQCLQLSDNSLYRIFSIIVELSLPCTYRRCPSEPIAFQNISYLRFRLSFKEQLDSHSLHILLDLEKLILALPCSLGLRFLQALDSSFQSSDIGVAVRQHIVRKTDSSAEVRFSQLGDLFVCISHVMQRCIAFFFVLHTDCFVGLLHSLLVLSQSVNLILQLLDCVLVIRLDNVLAIKNCLNLSKDCLNLFIVRMVLIPCRYLLFLLFDWEVSCSGNHY